MGAAVRATARPSFSPRADDPEPLAIVNALDYGASTTPGGFAAAFSYSPITAEIASANFLHPSFNLGGVSAEIDAQPVELMYVSRYQVNLRLPFDVSPGIHTIRLLYGDKVFAGQVNLVANLPKLLTTESGFSAGVVLPLGVYFAQLYGLGVTTRVDPLNPQVTSGSVWLVAPDGRQFEATYSGPSLPPIRDWQFVFLLPVDFFDRGPVPVFLRVCAAGDACVDSNSVNLRK
jgi:uncharacterized protein (TIGR03437 family)